MPKFLIETAAEHTITTIKEIEADNKEAAEEIFWNGGGETVDIIEEYCEGSERVNGIEELEESEEDFQKKCAEEEARP